MPTNYLIVYSQLQQYLYFTTALTISIWYQYQFQRPLSITSSVRQHILISKSEQTDILS